MHVLKPRRMLTEVELVVEAKEVEVDAEVELVAEEKEPLGLMITQRKAPTQVL